MLLPLLPQKMPVVLFVDETLERRRGAKINAKGYYRDAVRSSNAQVVISSGLNFLLHRAIAAVLIKSLKKWDTILRKAQREWPLSDKTL